MLTKAVPTISTDGIYTSNINPEKYDRGLGNWNRTQDFTANYVWNLPKVSTALGGPGSGTCNCASRPSTCSRY
jgi:hypothetical protein